MTDATSGNMRDPNGESGGKDLSSGGKSSMELDELHWGTLRDWSQLVRLPAVFTLFSNCVAAAIVAGTLLRPFSAMIPATIASLMVYWAGMILNDVVDLEEDAQHRPSRPLPSGRISPVIAGHVATGMLLLAPVLILATTTLHYSQPLWMGAAFGSAVALSLCVRAYDSWIKRTPLGPLLMGACRALNILMIGLTMFSVNESEVFPVALLYFAAGVGIYITGITIYARQEHQESPPALLLAGVVVEVAGLAVIAFLPRWGFEGQTWTFAPNQGYLLLIGLISMTVVHRGLKGVAHPVPRKVQLAVKHALLTMILLDACVVVMWAGPWYACPVAALLLPALSGALKLRTT